MTFRPLLILTSLAGLWLMPMATAQSTETPASDAKAPAMQLPADQVAYKAANTAPNGEPRIKALQDFLRDYPKSKRVDAAQDTLLKLLLERKPPAAREAHLLAQSMVDHASADGKAGEENSVAYELSQAKPNGVDLKSAEAWMKDSLSKVTIEAMTADSKASSEKYKYPMPSAEQIHGYWAQTRASYLQTLAEVYLHEGKLAEASKVLDEAGTLDPGQGYVDLTRGEIAHARHNDAEALRELETADVRGGVTPESEMLMTELYKAQHGGDAAGLDDELDKQYMALPKAFTPAAHEAKDANTGHPVLVELFTGAACEPCIAADLALDDVLQAYPRSEVVALSFDQHVPEPDPLANPDSVARGTYDKLAGTPTFRVDGVEVGGAFGTRKDEEKAFHAVEKAIDAALPGRSGLSFEVKTSVTSTHTIAVSADVRVTDRDALQKALLPAAEPGKDKDGADGADGSVEKPAAKAEEPQLVMNIALVQPTVRYSGENGIRFHSMVVRSLAKPADAGFPVNASGDTTASFTFDPAAVSAGLSKYLSDFAAHNERFGVVHFLSEDTRLPMSQMAIAAWVEDLKSHRVVAADFATLHSDAERAAR